MKKKNKRKQILSSANLDRLFLVFRKEDGWLEISGKCALLFRDKGLLLYGSLTTLGLRLLYENKKINLYEFNRRMEGASKPIRSGWRRVSHEYIRV